MCRYGTLPKNARIGAYLESLRRSGLQQGVIPTPDDSLLPDHLNYEASRDTVAMIRSNSTQGNFMPPSPLLARLSPRSSAPHRGDRERRSSAKELPTHSSNQHSSSQHSSNQHSINQHSSNQHSSNQHSSSQHSSNQHSIAHLEFPPPPNDLPPPPDDFLEDHTGTSVEFPPPPECDASSPEPRHKLFGCGALASPRSRRHCASQRRSEAHAGPRLLEGGLSCSPQPERAFAVTRRRLRDLDAAKKPPVKAKPHLDSSQDGADTSDGSPASRFGVNLRHRDQSSDSCDSVKSAENLSLQCAVIGASSRSNWSVTRSPGSSSADTVDTPPSPSCSHPQAEDKQLQLPSSSPAVRHSKPRESINSLEYLEDSIPDGSQAVQLVSELFESLRHHTGPPPADNGNIKIVHDNTNSTAESPFLSNLKKTKSSYVDRSDDICQSSIDFKSKLRKTDASKCPSEATPGDGVPSIVDFRAQLRRTHTDKEDGSVTKQPNQDSIKDNMNMSSQVTEEEMNKKNCDDGASMTSEHRNSLDSSSGKRDSANSDDDPKRFSSSSISNLKKLWEKQEEEKANLAKCDAAETGPKHAPGPCRKSDEPSPEEPRPGRLERRVWPPTHRGDDVPHIRGGADGKPTVPTKPSVKNLRPPPPSGGAVKLPPPKPAGIYATPSFIKQPSPLSLSKKDKDGNKMSRSCIEFKQKSSRHDSKESNSNISKKKVAKLSNITRHGSSENNGNDASPDSPGGSGAGERAQMLEETKNVEDFVCVSLCSELPLSSSACIQLVLRLEQFQMWCSGYVEQLPPQSRFQLLEMLSRLDGEVRQLRVRGGGRSPDHNSPAIKGTSQFPQLVATVKDICATLQR